MGRVLAVGNAVNGAKALGIDSTLMGGFNAKEYARILSLPESLVPTLLVALGKAADEPLPKVRFFKGRDIFLIYTGVGGFGAGAFKAGQESYAEVGLSTICIG